MEATESFCWKNGCDNYGLLVPEDKICYHKAEKEAMRMRAVRCHDCGKRYDFDKDDFCPRCGAFTPPPLKTRIGMDGRVVRVEGINEKNHRNSFVHAEYHEENRERKGTALEKGKIASVIRNAQQKSPLVQNKSGKGDLFSGLSDFLGGLLEGSD